MNKSDLVSIRDFQPEDANFILSTFLRGLYYGESCYSEVPKQIFMESYHEVVVNMLTGGKTSIRVACLKEDPEVILGYAILSTYAPACHWVFIKKTWRTIGLARDLVPSTITTVTHLTKVGRSISKNKGLQYNPFIK